MPRRSTPNNSLDNLKREAKRWLKALQANDPEARARLDRAVEDAPAIPALRHVQHALAREHGYAGWAALKSQLATGAQEKSPAPVMRFFDNACPDHHVRGGNDHLRARHTAMRLLARYPEIAHASFYTAVVCGDLERVQRMLAEQPSLATTPDSTPTKERSDVGGPGDAVRKDLGPKGWEPLLYLCFTRLPLPAANENAVAIARMLLDHGANPNAYFLAGSSRYTPLVGAVGEGEEERPPHPKRDGLVQLLLERGAEPYDIQVIYNVHFGRNILWWLQVMYERSLQLGRAADWNDPEWTMVSMGGYGSGARWHLERAVAGNDLELAAWCLTHGANPNTPPGRAERRPRGSLYEEAVRRGRLEMAELLVRHGAPRIDVAVDPMAAFVRACLQLDREEVKRQIAAHPEYLQAAEPMLEAAERNRVDVVEMLLDLGMSPNVENKTKERPLHYAGYNDAVDVAELLIARGAEIDPVESNWGNTPLGAAGWSQSRRMIDLLGRLSRDVWELTYMGSVERLQEVLRDDPERAKVVWDGHTPLMWLPPDDEGRALEIARLYLEHGADPTLRNNDGMTAADRAERIGMFEVAELLRQSRAPANSAP